MPRQRKVDAGDLHAEIAKVCPIVGCDSSGQIHFAKGATEAQKAEAAQVVARFNWDRVVVEKTQQDEIDELKDRIADLEKRR